MIGLSGAARIRDWARVNLVFDGNSLVNGVGASNQATTALPAQVAAASPINGVISATNLGIGGQTTRQMDGLDGGSASDIDGAYVSGKANVLVLWEGTNSICNVGRTSDQALSDLQIYVTDRQANGRQWTMMALTTLPRQASPLISSQTDINTYNAILADYNAKLMANYRALGLAAVADVRQSGSPFAFSDYSSASFGASNLWSEGNGSRVHLNDAGYALIASYVAAQWIRMPFRLAA